MSGVLSRLAGLVDVRPGELRRVSGMFALLGLIIATSYILKPVRSSLFLSQFGSERLPYVYILVALVLGVVSFGFARWTSRVNLIRLFIGASFCFSANLVLFWVATTSSWAWTGYVFYVWVSIFTALMPSLFWLLANYVFYANEGRRLFPVVMAGGILGSIVGGATTSLLVPWVGTSGLLLTASGLLLAIAALIRSTTTLERERMSERKSEITRQERSRATTTDATPWTLLSGSRYLSMLALLIAVTTTVSTLVDYQFNTVVEKSFETMDALTGFFGTFFAGINVVAFVLQLVVVGRLLGWFGVGAGLLMLPAALMGSSIAFLLVPQLLTAALIKSADDGLSNSVNKASVEVLYLPISLAVKNRLKAWLDMFVERLSRGVAGVTILVTTTVFSLTVSQMSTIVLALLVPWIAIVFMLRREYVKTFRDSLSRRDISDFASELRDQASRSVFQQALAGGDDREIVYVLALAHGIDDPEVVDHVTALTTSDDPAVRKAAFSFLRGSSRRPAAPIDYVRFAADDDPGVAAEALALWITIEPENGMETLRAVVEEGDSRRIDAVLDTLDLSEGLIDEAEVEAFVLARCNAPDPTTRRLAARGAGYLRSDNDATTCLSKLLQDDDLEVARAAASSIGRVRLETAFPLLIESLGRRPLRTSARKAIARFGTEKIDLLSERFRDESISDDIRIAIPLAIAEIDDQRAVNALMTSLPQEDRRLHYQGVKGLGKMRKRSPDLRFSRAEVDRLLKGEAARLTALASLRTGITSRQLELESHALLVRALDERLEFTRERIFRLLGLTYPPDAIFGAFNRITNGHPAVRAAALEYLSNALSKRHREWLLPLVEVSSVDELQFRGQRLFGSGALGFEEALARLVRHRDPWLAATAITVAGELHHVGLRQELEALTDHSSAIVRESAQRALARTAQSRY